MATITMKPDYPPSEVYSTSEPPPAYKQRPSSAVQIARIAAITVVASSFILGSFILASSWVAARASCHQLEQLDAMLDKELALEGRSYGNDGLIADELLPNAHALRSNPNPEAEVKITAVPTQSSAVPTSEAHTKEDVLNQAETKVDENKLQKLDGPKTNHISSSDESSDSDSSSEDDDELDGLRPLIKLPIQFDLDELAGAFLANNQKGRMNCMVERRREDPAERRFPFNILGAFNPRNAQAERVAIMCHGGDEVRPMNGFPEPQSQVFAFPLSGPVRLPLRPQPERPALEPRLPFGPLAHQRPPMFPLPMPWESSEEQMNGPREMRIHVQRVFAIPSGENLPPVPEALNPFAPPPPPPQNQVQEANEQSAVVHQFVPQTAPTQELDQPEISKMEPNQMNLPWGLTPEDLHVIHRTAQEAVESQRREQQMDNDMQEVKTIVNTLAAAAQAEAEAQAHAEAEARARADSQPEEPQPHSQEQEDITTRQTTSRSPRTLLLPQDITMDERPHYMQPRSVRSVDAMLHREKRVKRCACNCI